jgi:hypothetical protein
MAKLSPKELKKWEGSRDLVEFGALRSRDEGRQGGSGGFRYEDEYQPYSAA